MIWCGAVSAPLFGCGYRLRLGFPLALRLKARQVPYILRFEDRVSAMTLTIEPDEQRVAAWQAKAASQGLTVEAWLKKLADEDAGADLHPDPHPLQTAASIVLDAMRSVPPEAFANRPKDGASEHDHYLYGHPKRNL